jgi:hypothetical protein
MKFNLDDYETVESRIKKFYELHPDGRITDAMGKERLSHLHGAIASAVHVGCQRLGLPNGDEQEHNRPKATGYAFERDGTGGANQTSALENAETSAIGRALANMAPIWKQASQPRGNAKGS